MIAIAGIPTPETNSILFRGRDCVAWEKVIFEGFTWYRSGHDVPGDIDFLVLFNPGIFPSLNPEDIHRVVAHVSAVPCPDDNKETVGVVFALVGPAGPHIVVIPSAALAQLSDALGEATSFTGFLEHEAVQVKNIFLPEETAHHLLVDRDFREIENRVKDFQARLLTADGIIIEDFNHFYIEGLPAIGEGTRIASGVIIKGDCSIGKNVTLYPNVYIENGSVGDNCVVLPGCVIRDSQLECSVTIGPYTHLRNGALVKEGAKMGNFVEMKKSVLGKGSKSMHLSYIGDATVGEKVNIGAGTITCNYDGVNKNKTLIEDNVFIGSGTQLVAPVTVEKNSYVGAGSTITSDVPIDSLAIARQKQRNIIDWVKRKREKKKSKS
ncbi:MAG: hypothetical protein GY765_44095 [bacterium]|nr:hypothetical protein [bacterium]